jgi:Flp pilus assembly protein TadD
MLERGNVEGAVVSFRRAIALNPAAALAYRGLGAAYSAKGNTQEAAKAYRKYLILRPNSQDAPEVRALVQQLQ